MESQNKPQNQEASTAPVFCEGAVGAELAEEKMAELVKEILRNPKKYGEEAKLLLRLELWRSWDGDYVDEAKYDVIWGEVKEVVLREWVDRHPYRGGREVVLIPLKVPTVILYREVEDYEDYVEQHEVVYVFTGEQWVKVDVA